MKSSIPAIRKTRLSKIFTLQARENPEKPGRSIMDVWDIHKPLLKNFKNNYSYIVTLREKGNTAGNHYHKDQQELIYPIMGTLKIALENIESKEREEILLDAAKHQVIYFPAKTAHAIRAETKKAIFLVVTTSTKKEVFPYKIL